MFRLPLAALTAAALVSACSFSDGSDVATGSISSTTSRASASPTTRSPTSITTPTSTTTTQSTGSTTTPAIDTGWDTLVLPSLLLADGGVVREVRDGESEVLVGVDGLAARAFGTSTGVVLVDEIVETDYPSVHQYLVLGAGGADWIIPDDPGHLLDLVEIGGIPHIVYVDGESTGRPGRLVRLRDLTTGTDIDLGSAADSEFGVYGASVGGRLIAISAVADLTEIILFRGTDGREVDVASPTDDLAYNSPPFVGPARLSPDGTLLAYVEQPDTGFDSPTVVTGDTSLVIVDVGTGEEELRILVPEVDGVEALDYDGRWVALSTNVGDDIVPLLVDTGSSALAMIGLGELRGVVSLI